MKAQNSMPEPATTKYFIDRYMDDKRPGQVIGSRNADGVLRKGVDAEKTIGIDHGALRIRPLTRPGWGRSGIAYGPYTRANGLAFAMFLLNGHNTSQTGNLTQSLFRRLGRWVKGSETEGIGRRLLNWVWHGRKAMTANLFKRWIWILRLDKDPHVSALDENLSVGWFPGETSTDPLEEGNAFVVHAAGPENGELWSRVRANPLPAFKGLQNVPVYYVVILREQGSAYYVASVPSAHGLAAFPQMRPVAIDPFNDEATVYAALHQSVLGQIGFRVDTRVYAAQVAQIPELATWYGTAQVADRLTGSGPLAGSAAEVGGVWTGFDGNFDRTVRGIVPTGMDNLAVLDPGVPSGLIHVMVETAVSSPAAVNILWRVQDQANYWSWMLSSETCQLRLKTDGAWTDIAFSGAWALEPAVANSVQVLDDGQTFGLYLNGRLIFDAQFTDTRLQAATGVGIHILGAQSELRIHSWEAHPRAVPIPAALDLGEPWIPVAGPEVVADDFNGTAGDLAGRPAPVGSRVWRKEIGSGFIQLTGNSAVKVQASASQPIPGRTAYTVSWDDPGFADLQVNIIPPGTDRGQWEKGRGGLIFWQDAANYMIVSTWLDDYYDGASISSFFHLNGFEELYDAVWTNVGKRIYWGIPYTLRVAFDSLNYMAYVDSEPVLYRSLTDVYPDFEGLTINRVGIVANWEWGNDTGSVFKQFAARKGSNT